LSVRQFTYNVRVQLFNFTHKILRTLFIKSDIIKRLFSLGLL